MEKKFQSIDGNQAAAYTSYAFTEVAGIYPITPSSPMADFVDRWAVQGKKNLFGVPVKVVEMQSEAGAAGVVHGSLQGGALTTTYTASQGLLLKIPNMYKIAGQLLPGVMHVAARSLAAQSLSIFGDHQDIYAARQTGWAMIASGSVQQVMDLGGVAHLSAIKSKVPFLHFFDGFRTSHEVQKVEMMDYEVYDKLLDRKAVEEFRKNALNPTHPITRGSAQNDDVYFQAAEAQNKFWDAIPNIVENYMEEISKVTKRKYAPFVYYGAEDATDVIIAMGSVTETCKEVIDYLTAQGRKTGLLIVHLYRPFSARHFLSSMPKTVKRIAVLDRTKEKGALGEPLYLDVRSVYYGSENTPEVLGGRYGLSSKDVTPKQIVSVFNNLVENKIDNFTIGIEDDVTFKSLPVLNENINVADPTVTELLFWGLGSDGTVGASKNTIKIIGENTDLYGQSYSSYDSKKSGGVTRMHLRFGKNPIRSTYYVSNPHFVSCSTDAYLEKYDLIEGIQKNGVFLLNTIENKDSIVKLLPNRVKRTLASQNVKMFIINAVDLAKDIGLGNRINTIMQSAFFKLNPHILEYDKAKNLMKEFAEKTYSKRGEEIVKKNYEAIERGGKDIVEVTIDSAWAKLTDEENKVEASNTPDFVKNIAEPINQIKGYDIPVSAFAGIEDGRMINGSSAYEKRGIAVDVPEWLKENCIQCNLCAFACPHAVIRPFLSTSDETSNAPETTEVLKASGKTLTDYDYSIQVSTLDCTGCGVCVEVCPGKKSVKALQMVPIQQMITAGQQKQADYFFNEVDYRDHLVDKTKNTKNSQFAQPLFEFSGACAGCGETPYLKLATQLFGERMLIANATGCSSIYGASFPATPYTSTKEGKGPAWANSLFEDNAEFGFGMEISKETLRLQIASKLEIAKLEENDSSFTELVDKWLENKSSPKVTEEVSPAIIDYLEKTNKYKDLLTLKEFFIKQSTWIIGGDGWAYDIGFGGLDHVIANNEDVNILVLDTEVYSNTGGQSSKSSQSGSLAQFTAAGKPGKKKDLAAIAMTYGHVYVAQISHGASHMQTLKALREAENYPGPSIIIAYSPCIAFGLKGGLTHMMDHSNIATKCGYWPIFRYDPRLVEEGKNPLQLDMKEPDWTLYNDFLLSQSRYAVLSLVNPNKSKSLLEQNLKDSKARWLMYKRYANMDYSSQENSPN